MVDSTLLRLKVLITGCAGFIGSTIAEKLIERGYRVIGIDCFTNYYSPKLKYFNLSRLSKNLNFQLIKLDISKASFDHLLNIVKCVNYVIHEAAQPGVRESWGRNFQKYVRHNIIATQKIIEAVSKVRGIKRFIFASSSSVYGNIGKCMIGEDIKPKPVSPYGITKLAGEALCQAYRENYDLPLVILRYFTVYGPRQRPDMAFHKFIKAMLKNETIKIYGDGSQARDFTYVDDVAEATIKALECNEAIGEIINIGSGSPIQLLDAIKIIANIIGTEPKIVFHKEQKGDVKFTYADISKAEKILNWRPSTKFRDGLENQISWIKQLIHLNII